MKDSTGSFKESAVVENNVGSGIWRARKSPFGLHQSRDGPSDPTPMHEKVQKGRGFKLSSRVIKTRYRERHVVHML